MSGTNTTTGGLIRITRFMTPIRRRLVAVAALVVVGMLVVSWIKTSIWRELKQLHAEFAAVEAEAYYVGGAIRGGVSRMSGAALRYQLSGASQELDAWRAELIELSSRLEPTEVLTDAEKELLKKARTELKTFTTRMAPILYNRTNELTAADLVRVNDFVQNAADPLLRLGADLMKEQQTALGAVFSRAQNTIASLYTLVQISLLLLVFFLVANALVMYRALVAPLRAQLSATQAVVERQEKLASLGTLATGVAHEIRNPLTAIKFRLFSHRRSLPEPMREGEDLVVINSEINRLERIVKDFLQFARPTAPTLVKVSTDKILTQVHSLLGPPLAKNGITLLVENSAPAFLQADPQQVQQVLINLIQNAGESMDGGGRITLRTRVGTTKINKETTPVVMIDVVDTGKGMPAEVQKRIFDPFFSQKEGGTGLGLPIAARIVERHGGFLEFESQVNRGTTFHVVLPRIPSHGEPNSAD